MSPTSISVGGVCLVRVPGLDCVSREARGLLLSPRSRGYFSHIYQLQQLWRKSDVLLPDKVSRRHLILFLLYPNSQMSAVGELKKKDSCFGPCNVAAPQKAAQASACLQI